MKIDHKSSKFLELMKEHKIFYPSTVHHFEIEEDGKTTPVYWNEVKSTDLGHVE